MIVFFASDFNPQVPCGTRRGLQIKMCKQIRISIHRSLAGPDTDAIETLWLFKISIHRSLAGPDSCIRRFLTIQKNFNPQVPCGTRPKHFSPIGGVCNFNPQVPCGTRRKLDNGPTSGSEFQSTGPLRDPTAAAFLSPLPKVISIHRSLAGPDSHFGVVQSSFFISIHRSLAGPDFVCPFKPSATVYFNPQVPCGTRPIGQYWVIRGTGISIHRSLAGPDVHKACLIHSIAISIHRSLAGPDDNL